MVLNVVGSSPTSHPSENESDLQMKVAFFCVSSLLFFIICLYLHKKYK